jgi:hypothetical protein
MLLAVDSSAGKERRSLLQKEKFLLVTHTLPNVPERSLNSDTLLIE